MQSTTTRFHHNKLSASIHYPDSATELAPAIIFVHGFIGNKVGAHRLFYQAANYLTQNGFICFRFDFGGCGESDGEYEHVTVTKQLDELNAAIEYVSGLKGVNPEEITLIGHSLGGAITALTAPKYPQFKQVVLWSPVARPYTDITSITGEEAVQTAEIEGTFDYNGFLLSHAFFTDLKQHDPLQTITSYQGDVLLIHGDQDHDVPVKNINLYLEFLQRKGQATDYTLISGGDHTFANHHWKKRLFKETTSWLLNRVNLEAF
ncbi:alpha/beta hydrolase family protein [Halalkalibacter akibai]|uniref:Alpha/beta superfamily hydrolase n=1 Tax=Halalkalibacter akibai (strain ATCC 43226 / DSM 21942 / CIP 109018 / JCM 9157 / 1139) TaxID=1236973 RepID=W4QYK2_HALA3|nr:alpha/beta fold hydrolase [Halalkalibacter akibai]GAE36748.1 alpha/beta superfamily hydrolase [Halalkalibacter akibai JCM 9157]